MGTYIPTYPHFLDGKLILPNPDAQCVKSSFFCTLTCEASSTTSPFGGVVHLDSGTHKSSAGTPAIALPTFCSLGDWKTWAVHLDDRIAAAVYVDMIHSLPINVPWVNH